MRTGGASYLGDAARSSVPPPARVLILCLVRLNVFVSAAASNKKQCSRQLLCEVPCGVGNVVNSSLFINSSLSSLSSTSHAVHGGGPASGRGVLLLAGRGGQGGQGVGDISVQLPYILHYHMVLHPMRYAFYLADPVPV